MGITSFLSGMEWKQGSIFIITHASTKEQRQCGHGGEVLPQPSSPSPSPVGTPLPKGEARRCGQALGSPFGGAGKAAGFD